MSLSLSTDFFICLLFLHSSNFKNPWLSLPLSVFPDCPWLTLTPWNSLTFPDCRNHAFWILLKQEMTGWQCISWIVHKSFVSLSRQITMPAPQHSIFLQAGCPSCRPTKQLCNCRESIWPIQILFSTNFGQFVGLGSWSQHLVYITGQNIYVLPLS